MTPEQEESKAFIESQMPALQKQIREAGIMQMAWQAGGDTFKPQLDDVTQKLGAWLAVEANLKDQLAKLETSAE